MDDIKELFELNFKEKKLEFLYLIDQDLLK